MRTSMAYLAAAISVGIGQHAAAATFSLIPDISAAYSGDGSFTPLPGPPDTWTYDGNDRVFQIDIHISTSNLQAGERGFGGVVFDIDLVRVVDAENLGWEVNAQTVDANGSAPGGTVPLFNSRIDGGPDPNDLQDITAFIAGGINNPHSADPRVKIGQSPIPPNPSRVGTIYVLWNAQSFFQVSVTQPLFTPYMNDGTFGAAVYGTGFEVISAIPEPTTSALAGIGLAALVAVRMRRRNS